MSARLKLIMSMAIFGTLGIFVRSIPVSSGELALCRAVMAAVLIAGYLFVSKQRIPWAAMKHRLPLLFLSGAAMGINWILLFQAYRYTTVSIATLSYYFAPVIVTAACPLFFREKLTIRQVICFIMSTVGLVLIIKVSSSGRTEGHLTGILLGLAAAVFYAIVIIMNKFIRHVSGIHRTLLQFLAAILVLTPYVSASGGIRLGGLSAWGWICLLIVGIFHTGITYCMYFSALKDLKGQEAAILSYIDPLVAVAVSVLVLGEGITPAQITGGALILGFTCWNERESCPPSPS